MPEAGQGAGDRKVRRRFGKMLQHGDLHAIGGETLGDGGADAAGSSGDDGGTDGHGCSSKS